MVKKKAKKTFKKVNVYKKVTNQILDIIESGVIPWQKPWSATSGTPINIASKKPYKGMNIWLLMNPTYKTNFWGTFDQIRKLGGKVKKGQKSSIIVYWQKRVFKEKDEDGEEKIKSGGFLLKHYNVFNLEQCEDIEIPEPDTIDFSDIKEAEEVIKRMPSPPKIRHLAMDRAYYTPSKDIVSMPDKKQFKSEEEYYSTLFHELSHSTGHESRLKRKGITDKNMFGSHSYSKEELVAEFSSSYLRAMTGIDNEATLNNSASYIDGWSKALRKDEKLFIEAASKATKSANYILDIQPEYETKEK